MYLVPACFVLSCQSVLGMLAILGAHVPGDGISADIYHLIPVTEPNMSGCSWIRVSSSLLRLVFACGTLGKQGAVASLCLCVLLAERGGGLESCV